MLYIESLIGQKVKPALVVVALLVLALLAGPTVTTAGRNIEFGLSAVATHSAAGVAVPTGTATVLTSTTAVEKGIPIGPIIRWIARYAPQIGAALVRAARASWSALVDAWNGLASWIRIGITWFVSGTAWDVLNAVWNWIWSGHFSL